jgi:hypothetical protein
MLSKPPTAHAEHKSAPAAKPSPVAKATPTVKASAPAPPADPFAAVRKAEHALRGRLEEQYEAILEVLRVGNEDGSGKSWDQIKAAVSLADEELTAGLALLEVQGFVDRSTSAAGLGWHRRTVSPTQRIVIP